MCYCFKQNKQKEKGSEKRQAHLLHLEECTGTLLWAGMPVLIYTCMDVKQI